MNLFGSKQAAPVVLPPPPRRTSVEGAGAASTAAAYLANQGSGYASTIKTMGQGGTPLTSTAKLLGLTTS